MGTGHDDEVQEANEGAGSETVGARIRARRKKIGGKQAALAQEAGISAAQICHIEKGRVRPSLRTLEKIAGALGTTVSALLDRGDGGETRLRDAAPVPGDALASDALARGGGRDAGTGAAPGSDSAGGEKTEPVTRMVCVHDPRDTAVDRRVRARLRKELEAWKSSERAAGVPGRTSLPLFFPAAAGLGALLARELRTAAGIGPSAAVDPALLLENKGIRVVETALPSGLDSWAVWDPEDGTAFVFLRNAATSERKRFRLAYELGHLARFGVSAETFLYRISELGMVSQRSFKALRAKLKAHYAECRAAGNRAGFEPRPSRGAVGMRDAFRLRANAAEGRLAFRKVFG